MKTYIQQKLKTTFLIIMLLLVSLLKIDSLFAQASDKIVFTYDAAGNRIQRKLSIIANPNDPSFRMQNETTVILSETKDTILVSAYPNPVSSNLYIYFELLPPKADVKIKVTDYSGREMLNIKQTQTTENVNLESFATGIYIVNITINDKPKLLKVIKQ